MPAVANLRVQPTFNEIKDCILVYVTLDMDRSALTVNNVVDEDFNVDIIIWCS
jgi:hypothetical protein